MPPFDIPAAVSGHLSSLHSHDAQPQLAPTPIEHDLVDELHLMAFPVVLGTGKHLFVDTSAGGPATKAVAGRRAWGVSHLLNHS